jgi:hypothetical protein
MSGRRGAVRAAGDSSRATPLLWGRATVAVQLNERMSIVATAGSAPTAGGAEVATTRFATIGLRLSPVAMLRPPLPAAVRPTASAFRVERVSPDMYRVIVRVPGARTVELSGDFNGWTAVVLRESAPDQWETTLPLAPGTHRVSVRVNEDHWTAPPGLPSVDDEFSGSVGLLVVR